MGDGTEAGLIFAQQPATPDSPGKTPWDPGSTAIAEIPAHVL